MFWFQLSSRDKLQVFHYKAKPCEVFVLFREHSQTGRRLLQRCKDILKEQDLLTQSEHAKVVAAEAVGKVPEHIASVLPKLANYQAFMESQQEVDIALGQWGAFISGTIKLIKEVKDVALEDALMNDFAAKLMPVARDLGKKVQIFVCNLQVHLERNPHALVKPQESAHNAFYYANMIDTFVKLFEDHWVAAMSKVEAQIVNIEAANLGERMVVKPASTIPWLKALSQVYMKLGELFIALPDWKDCLPATYSDFERRIGGAANFVDMMTDETSLKAFAALCHSVVDYEKFISENMIAVQKAAYEQWLHAHIHKGLQLARDLIGKQSATGNTVLTGVVKQFKEACIQRSLDDVCKDCLLPDVPLTTAALGCFVQPDLMEERVRAMSLAAGDEDIVRECSLLLCTSKLKQRLIKLVCNCKPLQYAREYSRVLVDSQGVLELISKVKRQDAGNANILEDCRKVVHKLVAQPFVESFLGSVQTMVAQIELLDYEAIILTQVYDQLKLVFMSQKTVDLVGRIEDSSEVWKVFSEKTSLRLNGSNDQAYTTAIAQSTNRLLICKSFAAAWDGADLLLNTLPADEKVHTKTSKRAFVREYPNAVAVFRGVGCHELCRFSIARRQRNLRLFCLAKCWYVCH